MGIFDSLGNPIQSCFHLNSVEADMAYDIAGDIVFNKTPKEKNYDVYTISPMFTYSLSKMQSFAIWDGKIAQVREGYSLHIIDIATHAKIKEVTMDMGHGNSCQFSSVFYDVNDEFPLFYIRNSGVWVYRIVDTTSTLIKKYSFPVERIGTYVAGFGIDSENGLFYTASYTEGDYTTKTGLFRVCVWDMENETDNGDGTYTMAFISSNDLPWFTRYEAIQGCCYHDGYFFVSTGMPNTQQYVVMIGKDSLSIEHENVIGNTVETEGCAWVNDDYMVVGQSPTNITYRKVEFATTE